MLSLTGSGKLSKEFIIIMQLLLDTSEDADAGWLIVLWNEFWNCVEGTNDQPTISLAFSYIGRCDDLGATMLRQKYQSDPVEFISCFYSQADLPNKAKSISICSVFARHNAIGFLALFKRFIHDSLYTEAIALINTILEVIAEVQSIDFLPKFELQYSMNSAKSKMAQEFGVDSFEYKFLQIFENEVISLIEHYLNLVCLK